MAEELKRIESLRVAHSSLPQFRAPFIALLSHAISRTPAPAPYGQRSNLDKMRTNQAKRVAASSPLRLLAAMCAFIGVAQPQSITHGTTYAVERTPSIVAVSIDSSHNTLDLKDDSQRHDHPGLACKIHASKGTVFITSGITGFLPPHQTGRKETFLDFHKVIGDIIAHSSTEDQAVATLELRLKPLLDSSLHVMSRKNQWKDGSSALQVFMAGANDGVPFLRITEFLVHRSTDSVYVIARSGGCPGDCVNGLRSYTTHLPLLYLTDNVVEDVRKRVTADIQSGNEVWVGPIQTVTISPNGNIRWIDKPTFCPMVPNY